MPAWDAAGSFRDKEAFGAAAAFYSHGGLLTHPKKVIRREPVITGWGAEIEGGTGFIGPPRHKLAGLCFLAAQLAANGIICAQLHGTVCGSRSYVLTFRRTLYNLFNSYVSCVVDGP